MDDASATLRGFRSQALYVLHRVITDPRRRELTFFPEGDEDVSIWAGGSSPIESIQVKDRSAGLTLSMNSDIFVGDPIRLAPGDLFLWRDPLI